MIRPNKRLRVGVDATTWWNNRGFGRFTRGLVSALVERDQLDYVLLTDRPDDGSMPKRAKVVAGGGRPITQTAVQSGARGLKELAAMSRLVARERFDVFFFPAVYSYFPLFTKTPCVVAFHDTIAERFPELTFPTKKNRLLWQTKTQLAKLQARRVMTVSEASARDLRAILGVHPSKIDVVTEGPDPIFSPPSDQDAIAAERRALKIPKDEAVLVYVGGLNPHKNLLALLAALRIALQKGARVHLAIVGDISGKGFFDNVEELMGEASRDVHLQTHVTFTGRLADERLINLFGSATALVLPSLWEGFGLPAVEAMACGVPVLASRRGSLPEVVGPAGLLFDPARPEDIAARILQLIADPALREELARRALVQVKNFTWARGAELAEASLIRTAG